VGGIDIFLLLVLDGQAAAETRGRGGSVTAGPAQYLLRFDDLCPTHDPARWGRFPPLFSEFKIKPILAVVPDNRDPELAVSPPDPAFWREMQALEADGAVIGLHGYKHLCLSQGRSLVPLHGESEFAGVDEDMQRTWIHSGVEILRGYGLNPSVWVAPRHGFDSATIRALKAEGLTTVSDGFARRPFLRDGVTWIPQQIWEPASKPSGLWTICLHANTATDALVDGLREFLRQNAERFTSVDRVMAEWPLTALSAAEALAADAEVLRIRARRASKRLIRRGGRS
jgi:hypothetical protein